MNGFELTWTRVSQTVVRSSARQRMSFPPKSPASRVCSHVTPKFKGQREVLCHLAHLPTLWSFQQVCQPMLILVQTCIFYLISGVHITFVTCYSHDS